MTREKLTEEFLNNTSNNFILQLPTGFGKTKLALQKVNQWYKEGYKILIVIPYNVLIKNWKEEIIKWGYKDYLDSITFSTYVSLPKHCGKIWDIIIFDEGHHTSERCQDALKAVKVKHTIVLSATLKRDHLYFFKYRFKSVLLKVDVKAAIESEVLPDPKIILIPISLDNSRVNHFFFKNERKKGDTLTIEYRDKWKYKSYKGPLRIRCTQQQYYNELSGLIEWYKQKGMHNAIMKNMWLHKAGERLKWLAEQKEGIIKNLLRVLKDYRTLTFCQSIAQSKTLGCPCINSEVGTDNLERFNNKKIKHIAAISMLDEGQNLTDCKIGLFQMINSSDKITIQRTGRIMRHKEPVLIFPYFIGTREQEIIEKIMQDYNPSLITKLPVYNIENIKRYL